MPTSQQIEAFMFFIHASHNTGDPLIRHILYYLICGSNGLTQPVRVTLYAGRDGYIGKEIFDATCSLHGMLSINGTTHLDDLLAVLGCEKWHFLDHYGDYEKGALDTEGIYGGPNADYPGHENDRNMPIRYTFWLTTDSFEQILSDQGIQVCQLPTLPRSVLLAISPRLSRPHKDEE